MPALELNRQREMSQATSGNLAGEQDCQAFPLAMVYFSMLSRAMVFLKDHSRLPHRAIRPVAPELPFGGDMFWMQNGVTIFGFVQQIDPAGLQFRIGQHLLKWQLADDKSSITRLRVMMGGRCDVVRRTDCRACCCGAI